MKKKEVNRNNPRVRFLETYGELSDSDTLKEILYTKKIQIDKLERIRSNTSKLVWWVVVIPIVVGIGRLSYSLVRFKSFNFESSTIAS